MTRSLSIAQLKAHLSEVLGEVQHARTQIVIEKHGKPVAMLMPWPAAKPVGLLGLVGALKDGAEFADVLDAVVRTRKNDRPRKVPRLK